MVHVTHLHIWLTVEFTVSEVATVAVISTLGSLIVIAVQSVLAGVLDNIRHRYAVRLVQLKTSKEYLYYRFIYSSKAYFFIVTQHKGKGIRF